MGEQDELVWKNVWVLKKAREKTHWFGALTPNPLSPNSPALISPRR